MKKHEDSGTKAASYEKRALDAFAKVGLKPLTAFPGKYEKWTSQCQVCLEHVSPNVYTVVEKGHGGCKVCGARKTSATKKANNIPRAMNVFSKKGLEPMGPVVSLTDPVPLRCRNCDRRYISSAHLFRDKRVCVCKRPKRLPTPSLLDDNPKLSKEWHPNLNDDLGPENFGPTSKYEAWWICPEGHEYQGIIAVRNVHGSNCGYCSGKKLVKGKNDFASLHPETAKEWDWDLNNQLGPDEVFGQSNTKYWWRCSKDPEHVWMASPAKRHIGRGCPICGLSNFKVGVNDILSARPDFAEEWSPKNEKKPSEVPIFAIEKYLWNGSCGHEWTQSPKSRARGFGCTVCTGKEVLEGANDLASQFPDSARFFDEEKNGVSATAMLATSPKKVWWFCEQGHEYPMVVVNKTRKSLGCPVCSNKVTQTGVNDITSSSPEIARIWDYDRNSLDPKKIGPGSHLKAWWKCPKGHDSYEATVRSRNFFGCPYCSGRYVVPGETDLATLAPELASQWHPSLNDREPVDVSIGSDYFAWWVDEQGHEWQQGVQVRSRGVGCPECAQIGFNSTRPGTLYFLKNEELAARKIGITGNETSSDRLTNFSKAGWVVVHTESSENGRVVLDAETRILRWLRKDLGLPPYLSVQEMGRLGGWSETFSMDGPKNTEVIDRMKKAILG